MPLPVHHVMHVLLGTDDTGYHLVVGIGKTGQTAAPSQYVVEEKPIVVDHLAGVVFRTAV